MKDLLDTLIGNTIAPGESGQGSTKDHNELTNRDAEDQHPISAITGLQDSLDNKANKIDYSTEEQDTGLKWIDGRTIYKKTYVIETTTSISIVTLPITDEPIGILVDGEGFSKITDDIGAIHFRPFNFYSDSTMLKYFVEGATNLPTISHKEWLRGTDLTITITLFYTKTT